MKETTPESGEARRLDADARVDVFDRPMFVPVRTLIEEVERSDVWVSLWPISREVTLMRSTSTVSRRPVRSSIRWIR